MLEKAGANPKNTIG